MKNTKRARRGQVITATWPDSGRTYTYNSITALTKVLSGTGEVDRTLQGQIKQSAQYGKPLRGIYVDYV